ncbi:MAG: methionine adenosyltransferase [Candidatus Bathyarchaeia archaeon]
MAKVLIERLGLKPVEQQAIEIVERKGRGHPDYVIDAAAENVSRELCKFYLDNVGGILHHNVDKGLIVGGRSTPRFGGGEIEERIYIVVAGRAVTQASKSGEILNVPIDDIAPKAITDFLKSDFRFLDIDRHVNIDHKIRPGSMDLVKIYEQSKGVPLANDTSFGVCFAPLTPTEKLALETERYLNSEKIKKELPEVGEDIKVMALRKKNETHLTIAAAMISSLIPDKNHYMSIKEDIVKRVENFSSKITDSKVEVRVNTGDNPRSGIYYLTVTGTSAERGDDGNIGRGNRINGLITPCRQMSLEAAAGKNPVSHVGKTYNVLARIVSEKLVKEVKGVQEAYVKILSQIGKPISDPQISHVQLVLEKGYSTGNVSADVKSIVDEQLANTSRVTEMICNGEVQLF